MKNLQSSQLLASLVTIKDLIVRYRIILFAFIIAIIMGFMILRISQMSTMEPSVQQKNDALQSVKVVKIDESAINVIKQLESKDITIEALFDPGRYDPFQD